jgi:hypothetical protein
MKEGIQTGEKNQYTPEGEVILDEETRKLYEELQNKSHNVVPEMMFFT